MKNSFGKIVILVIVLVVAYWLVSGIISTRRTEIERRAANAAKAEETQAQAEKRPQIKKSVEDMVTKYNAVTDWQQSLKRIGLLEPAFTIEVQDALIRKDGRPIVLLAAVEDIARDSSHYTVYFHSHNFLDLLSSADVHFVLDCAPEHVKEIMKQSNSAFENYAVVAQVTSARKVKYGVVTDGDNGVKIDPSLSSANVFEASGRCLDLILVGNYELDDLLETSSK